MSKEPEGKEYRVNIHTKEIHHMPARTVACRVDEIKSYIEFDSLKDARETGYQLCAFCFRSEG